MGAEMWQSVGLTVLVIVATLVCVLLFMLFGKCVFMYIFKRTTMMSTRLTDSFSLA